MIYLSKTLTNNVLISTVFAILSFAEWVVIEWAHTEDEKEEGLKIIKTTSNALVMVLSANTWLWYGVHLAQQKYNLVPNDDPPGENRNDGAPVEDRTEGAQGELRNEVVVELFQRDRMNISRTEEKFSDSANQETSAESGRQTGSESLHTDLLP